MSSGVGQLYKWICFFGGGALDELGGSGSGNGHNRAMVCMCVKLFVQGFPFKNILIFNIFCFELYNGVHLFKFNIFFVLKKMNMKNLYLQDKLCLFQPYY